MMKKLRSLSGDWPGTERTCAVSKTREIISAPTLAVEGDLAIVGESSPLELGQRLRNWQQHSQIPTVPSFGHHRMSAYDPKRTLLPWEIPPTLKEISAGASLWLKTV